MEWAEWSSFILIDQLQLIRNWMVSPKEQTSSQTGFSKPVNITDAVAPFWRGVTDLWSKIRCRWQWHIWVAPQIDVQHLHVICPPASKYPRFTFSVKTKSRVGAKDGGHEISIFCSQLRETHQSFDRNNSSGAAEPFFPVICLNSAKNCRISH